MYGPTGAGTDRRGVFKDTRPGASEVTSCLMMKAKRREVKPGTTSVDVSVEIQPDPIRPGPANFLSSVVDCFCMIIDQVQQHEVKLTLQGLVVCAKLSALSTQRSVVEAPLVLLHSPRSDATRKEGMDLTIRSLPSLLSRISWI